MRHRLQRGHPGLAMGPGGSPFTVYVLYGCGGDEVLPA